MKFRHHLALVVLLLVGGLGALVASETRLTLPVLGRDYVLRFSLEAGEDGIALPQVFGPRGDDYPIILIDPGHGGFDYGATGGVHREKDLVLGLARALRDRLLESGDSRVAMTRDRDAFLSLDERLAMVRDLKPDLFLSLHADSAGEQGEVTGASIYTLSQSASSRAAARFADRENRADQINGIALAQHSPGVNTILVDLSRRRTLVQSREFARLLEESGTESIHFHAQSQRSASLVVLKSLDTPSVLFEAGYVSNTDDAARLASEEGRDVIAEAMASAVRAYFIRQQAAVRPSDR